MQLQEILRLAAIKLRTITDIPELEADLLLGHVLNLSRAQLLVKNTQTISPTQEREFLHLLTQRIKGVPIAYLLGQREFWSLSLEVTSATLIPRPETELLVEVALSKFPQQRVISLADLGTGSGAVALAIGHERPNWHIIATDNSAAALEVANRNAGKLGINNVTFRLGNWGEGLQGLLFDAIVSNPPYIPEQDPHLKQGDVSFEPITALTAGSDGLRDLKAIIQQAKDHLNHEGWLMLEHGYDQALQVQDLLAENNYTEIASHEDLSGYLRVTVGRC